MVGSFQKDGVGMEDGLEPKTIKGPDVPSSARRRTSRDRRAGRAAHRAGARLRRRQLELRAIPFVHRLLPTRDGLKTAYHALDAYVVASRQEGGPKSILESMAVGVPLVTTRAGQAPELVIDGTNGILVDVEDAEALAAALVRVHANPALGERMREAGRVTAVENAHERLAPRWAALLDGFAERDG